MMTRMVVSLLVSQQVGSTCVHGDEKRGTIISPSLPFSLASRYPRAWFCCILFTRDPREERATGNPIKWSNDCLPFLLLSPLPFPFARALRTLRRSQGSISRFYRVRERERYRDCCEDSLKAVDAGIDNRSHRRVRSGSIFRSDCWALIALWFANWFPSGIQDDYLRWLNITIVDILYFANWIYRVMIGALNRREIGAYRGSFGCRGLWHAAVLFLADNFASVEERCSKCEKPIPVYSCFPSMFPRRSTRQRESSETSQSRTIWARTQHYKTNLFGHLEAQTRGVRFHPLSLSFFSSFSGEASWYTLTQLIFTRYPTHDGRPQGIAMIFVSLSLFLVLEKRIPVISCSPCIHERHEQCLYARKTRRRERKRARVLDTAGGPRTE